MITLRLASDADVPELRRLVNAAYKELADMGLNYTGSFQDEKITRERMEGHEVYLAYQGDLLIATISLEVQEEEPPVLYISQLAVHPDHKRQGLGSYLLGYAEQVALEKGILRLQLDTATTATHLVQLYTSLRYQVIKDVHWEGKTYSSYIMEKHLERGE